MHPLYAFAESITEAARTIREPRSVDDTLQTIVEVACNSVPGFDQVGIATMHTSGKGIVETRAFTGDLVVPLDKVQYGIRQGPCSTVLQGTDEIAVSSLRREQRWPAYVPEARAKGVRSQMALRLELTQGQVGGINFYSTTSDEVSQDAQALGRLFATHAATTLGHAYERDTLNEALHSRKVIGQALGILMERYEMNEERSFAFLVRASSHGNIKLRTIAQELVAQANQRTGARQTPPAVRQLTEPQSPDEDERHTVAGFPPNSTTARVELLEAALRESENRLQFLVDAVSEYAIFALDPNGIIASWNTGAERMKGYTHEEAIGNHFSMLYRPADRDSGLPQRLLDQALAERSLEHTGWRIRKDGYPFWSDIVISALHDDHGTHTGFVKVVRDRTEQHSLEAAQDSFYHAFEHDFRVPITAIQGFAELIVDAQPEDQPTLAKRIDSNADRLMTMVEQLVAYARLRSGRTPIHIQNVDMTALARLAVANLSSIADTSRVQITSSAKVMVAADPVALERVIANLVTNALNYSPAESVIRLICERVEEVGRLQIVDHGRGIDKRDLGSIFLEFERGRLSQDHSGSGLGLASVRRLVDLQSGTVAISSQVGVGTTVTVQLPHAPD